MREARESRRGFARLPARTTTRAGPPPSSSPRSRRSPSARPRTRSSSPPSAARAGTTRSSALVSNEREAVAALAADAVCACADKRPAGARSRIAAASAPGRRTSPPSRSGAIARPLRFSLRHVREPNLGGEKKSIPNIAWHSGVVLARWLAGYAERRASDPARSRPAAAKRVFAPDEDDDDDDAIDALEIGAGLGAPSFAAAAYALASRVAVTDVDPAAVRNAAYNAARGAVFRRRARVETDGRLIGRLGRRRVFRRVRSRGSIARRRAVRRDDAGLERPGAHPRGRARAPRARPEVARRVVGDEEEDVDVSRRGLPRRPATTSSPTTTPPPPPPPPRRRRLRVASASCWARTSCTRTAWLGASRAPSASVWTSRGVALICNPAPEHRAGAAELPDALEANGWSGCGGASRARASRRDGGGDGGRRAGRLRDPREGRGGGAAGRGGRRRGVGPVRRVKQARGFSEGEGEGAGAGAKTASKRKPQRRSDIFFYRRAEALRLGSTRS